MYVEYVFLVDEFEGAMGMVKIEEKTMPFYLICFSEKCHYLVEVDLSAQIDVDIYFYVVFFLAVYYF
jgi:hypothetical protein